jgi:hypothetical protein
MKICGFIYGIEEQNKLKIKGFLLVMLSLLFQPRIQSRYSVPFIMKSGPANNCMNLPAPKQRGIKPSFRKAQRAYPESRFPLSRE